MGGRVWRSHSSNHAFLSARVSASFVATSFHFQGVQKTTGGERQVQVLSIRKTVRNLEILLFPFPAPACTRSVQGKIVRCFRWVLLFLIHQNANEFGFPSSKDLDLAGHQEKAWSIPRPETTAVNLRHRTHSSLCIVAALSGRVYRGQKVDAGGS